MAKKKREEILREYLSEEEIELLKAIKKPPVSKFWITILANHK